MITYSVETLYHFQCDRCSKWWTIGDWDESADSMCCPHCGVRQEVEETSVSLDHNPIGGLGS